MIDKILALLGSGIEMRRREFKRRCATDALAALFGLASLGFGAFTAYLRLSASFGAADAAFFLCAASAAIFVAILGASAWRRRKARLRPARMTPPSAAPESLASLFEAFLATGAIGDQKSLLAAIQIGRRTTPMDLVVLALVGGFIASREFRK